MDLFLLIIAIIVGSGLSLLGGALLFTTKKRRKAAVLIALPFGAGALLAAAFFDLLPEAFELADPRQMLLWTLGGFLAFFALERGVTWFHHHHEHNDGRNDSQRKLIILGDITHNAIDGAAIGAAFVVNPALGIVTTLAVSAHEIPKELGTFAMLLSRGWRLRTVLLANAATAVATLIAAVTVFLMGSSEQLPIAPLLAITAGFFIYIAASDIIPDIHEQPRRQGMIQAATLLIGVVLVGSLITVLHETGAHSHGAEASEHHTNEEQEHHHEDDHDHAH